VCQAVRAAGVKWTLLALLASWTATLDQPEPGDVIDR
jgi:hypothetical protein